VRHLHTLQDVTLGLFSNDQLDFWRASAEDTKKTLNADSWFKLFLLCVLCELCVESVDTIAA
jgi:hypothetical protein